MTNEDFFVEKVKADPKHEDLACLIDTIYQHTLFDAEDIYKWFRQYVDPQPVELQRGTEICVIGRVLEVVEVHFDDSKTIPPTRRVGNFDLMHRITFVARESGL